MLKRLPLLSVALLALAACSHSGDNGPAAPSATPASSAPAAAASTPPAASAPASPATTAAPVSAATTAATSTASAPATTAAAPAADDSQWVEGKNYFVIDPAQPPTGHPGKIVVTEVFSYGCPACNAFHTTVDAIARSLPANAVLTYSASNLRPDENWTVYQRAYYAADTLGLVAKTHDALFDATWKTGETATYDLSLGRPKPKAAWPTIDTLAKFYAKYGANPKEFVAVADSFSVNTKMHQADALQKAYGVNETPTMVVDGKYRYTPISAGGYPQTVALTKWLVAKEAAAGAGK